MNYKTQACHRIGANHYAMSLRGLCEFRCTSRLALAALLTAASLFSMLSPSAVRASELHTQTPLRSVGQFDSDIASAKVVSGTAQLEDDGIRGDPQALALDGALISQSDAQPDASIAQAPGSRRIYLPVAYAAASSRAPAAPVPAPTTVPRQPAPAPTPAPRQPAPAPPPTAPSSNAPCTIQVSADGQAGTVSIYTAIGQAVPGSVICMRGGTYTLSRTVSVNKAGRSDAWIVIRAADANRVDMVWDPNTNVRTRGIPMMMFSGANAAYWEVRDVHLDASNQANAGVFCRDGHHIRVINTTIQNGDEAGFSTVNCDYLTAIGNRIYRSGYGRGWSSAITFNKTRWHDNYSGFHNVVIGNVISGMFDNSSYHTDGNGIILDLSAGYGGSGSELSSANTPPALIANNVVYHNGGKCIDSYGASNGWIVNNTCFQNALDGALKGPGEIKIKSSKNVVVANNIAVGSRTPYLLSGSTGVRLANNLQFDPASLAVEAGALAADGEATVTVNPLFVRPPTTSDSYRGALPPWQVGDGLKIRDGSPAIDSGVDLTTLTEDANLKRELEAYLKTDFTGAPRKQGAQVDLGAYEIK
jgi:hypothetical protein